MDTIGTDLKQDWSYIAEGGASIAFSYAGPFQPLVSGKVLCLHKSPHLPSVQSPHPHLGTDEEPDDPSVMFQNTVISKLVLNTHLPDVQTVKVSSQWLQHLIDVAEPCWPIEHIVKDGMDMSKSRAVLVTDLIGGQGWVIEIKVVVHDIQVHSLTSHVSTYTQCASTSAVGNRGG